MYHQSQHTSLFQHWSARFHPKKQKESHSFTVLESFIFSRHSLFTFLCLQFKLRTLHGNNIKGGLPCGLLPGHLPQKNLWHFIFGECCKLVSVIAPFGLEMPEPIYQPFVLVNNANLPDSLSFSLNA